MVNYFETVLITSVNGLIKKVILSQTRIIKPNDIERGTFRRNNLLDSFSNKLAVAGITLKDLNSSSRVIEYQIDSEDEKIIECLTLPIE